MNFKTLAFASFMSTLAAGASAEIYHCKFRVPGGNGFVPREVIVDFKSVDKAEITDPITVHMGEAPKAAKYAQNTTKRVRVRWTVEGVPSAGGLLVTADYSLVFNKARKRADVTMGLRGFDNTDAGNGTCTLKS